MTIYFQDGFDLYAQTSDILLNYIQGGGTLQTAGGRFGGGAWQQNAGNLGLTFAVPPVADLWLAASVNCYNTNAGDRILFVFASPNSGSNGAEIQITYNSGTGTFKVYKAYVATVLGSVTRFVPQNQWHWLEARCVLDATAGIVELWLDDEQIINLTGVNTVTHAGETQLVSGAIGDNFATDSLAIYVDDIIASDFRVGDTRIETMVPTSDASPNDGTPSTGVNHYACVDEAQFNTSDFITIPHTSGDKEVFGHGSIASTPVVVHSVQVILVSQKTDAGAFSLEPLVVSSGTEGDGSAQALSTSWGVQKSIFELDPHTSAAWAYTAANSADVGYKVP